MQARQAPYGIAGLGECDERLGAEAFPDVAGGLCEQVTHGRPGWRSGGTTANGSDSTSATIRVMVHTDSMG